MMSSQAIIAYATNDEISFGDCDCSGGSPYPQFNTVDRPAFLRLHPALLWLSLDAEYSVACVPSLSRVAVVNQRARALLETFSSIQPCPTADPEASEVVEIGYHLGLLTDGDGSLPPPLPPDQLVAWLHLTNACNLNCSYCYIAKSNETMSSTTARSAVDAVVRSARMYGYRRVLLKYAGGEASLVMPLVAATHAYAQAQCQAAGIELSAMILSNGTALTHIRLEELQQLGLQLMISLDGLDIDNDVQRPTRGGAGSSRAVCAGIERALAHDIVPSISITVTSDSISGLPRLLRWLLQRNLPFTISFARPLHGKSSLDELRHDEQRIIEGMRAAYTTIAEHPPDYSLLGALLDRANLGHSHSRTCAVGENYLVIDHHGRVAKCQMDLAHPVTTTAVANPLALVRADTQGIQNVPVDQKAGCRSCQWRYWCTGGCAVATYRATGRYDIQSPNCGIYQALFPDVVRLEGRRLLAKLRACV